MNAYLCRCVLSPITRVAFLKPCNRIRISSRQSLFFAAAILFALLLVHPATYAAVYTVTSSSDFADDSTIDTDLATDTTDGSGLSLREAMNYAVGGDTVNFDGDIDGQTIGLSFDLTLPDGIIIDADAVSTLAISGQTLDLSGDLTVSNGDGDLLSIGSTLSGTNVLTKTGAGKLTLSSAFNSETSWSTIVTDGTLGISSDDDLGSGTLTLNGGELNNDNSAFTLTRNIILTANSTINLTDLAVTVSGSISGSGLLTKTGTPTLTLSGTNSYSGGTAISGTLSIASGSNLGSGTVTLNLNSTLVVTGSNSTVSNAIDLANNSTISNANAVALSGSLNGTGNLTKAGAGALTLSNSNTYTGGTTVSAGSLLVTGALNGTTSLAVDSGATLGGTGSVFAGSSSNTATLSSGSTLAPGISGPGTLTINGNLSLNGAFQVNLNGTTAGTTHDSVTVSGTVTLGANSSISATIGGGYTPVENDTFRLIDQTGSGTISGTFNGLAEGASYTSGSQTLIVSYVGGSGNDLTNRIYVNQAPVLTIGNSHPIQYVSGSQMLFATQAIVSDSDSSDFNTGILTVDFTAPSPITNDDRLGISPQGTGSGQVGISGSNVSYSGNTIGVLAGGIGSTALTITFNSANATPAAAQALIHQLTFENTSGSPGSATRTIRIRLSDGDGATSSPISKSFTMNQAPSVVNDATTTAEDTPLTIIAASLLLNDSDPDGDSLSVTGVSGASNGGVALNTGVITFTPAVNFNGTASFQYTVSDGQGNSVNGTVNVTVSAVNDTPYANNVTANVSERTSSMIILSGSDFDNNALLYTSVSDPKLGTLSSVDEKTGTVSYTPPANLVNKDYLAVDSFTFKVNDGIVDSTNTATVTINIRNVNDPPVASTKTVVMGPGQSNMVHLFAFDEDPNESLFFVLVKGPSFGTIYSYFPANAFLYRPNNGFIGKDTVTFKVVDSGGLYSEPATVTILVQDQPTSTPTMTLTSTSTATATRTPTPTRTQTPTASATHTHTSTPTPSPSNTARPGNTAPVYYVFKDIQAPVKQNAPASLMIYYGDNENDQVTLTLSANAPVTNLKTEKGIFIVSDLTLDTSKLGDFPFSIYISDGEKMVTIDRTLNVFAPNITPTATPTSTNTPTPSPTKTPIAPNGRLTAVTDDSRSTENLLKSGTDYDNEYNRTLNIHWNIPNAEIDMYHVYVRSNGGPEFTFLGTATGKETSYLWSNAFYGTSNKGPKFNTKYEFIVYARNFVRGGFIGPYTTQGTISHSAGDKLSAALMNYPFGSVTILPTVWILDDATSTVDLTGGEDTDPPNDRALAVKWYFDDLLPPPQKNRVYDFHIYVGVNGARTEYLGRTNSASASHFEWRARQSFKEGVLAPAFEEGPKPGNKYFFSVHPMYGPPDERGRLESNGSYWGIGDVSYK